MAQGMSEPFRRWFASARTALRPLIPKRLRGDIPVVPVVRLSGSIGVVGGTFGFVGLMEKLGIERRLYISGEHKARLDPFLPEKAEDVERIKSLQRDIHADFIALVKESRGTRLAGPENVVFSGDYWTGRKAIELGLADRIGDLRTSLRERFGDKVVMPLIAPERSL